jgi:rRNA maturation endonuclease Nob1
MGARKQHHECVECEGVFKISYDLDEQYYNVEFCPFCGAGMDEDQQDIYEDNDEEELS